MIDEEREDNIIGFDYFEDQFNQLSENTQNAIDLILDFGSYDGSHHKQWVLTQVLKALCSEEVFQDILDEGWDEGIAP